MINYQLSMVSRGTARRACPRMSTMIILYLILAITLLSTSAQAKEKWDRADKVLFGSFLMLETIDYLQTRDILSNPKYREKNPILKNAGKTEATAYFALCSIGTYLIADHFTSKQRKVFLTVINVIQIKNVRNNHQIGVRLKF